MSPKKKLELALLASLKRQENKTETLKRNRVKRKFAESLTCSEVLTRMKITKEARALKTTNKNKARKETNVIETSSESEINLSFNDDSDMDVSENYHSEVEEELEERKENCQEGEPKTLEVGCWVLVKFEVEKNRTAKKNIYHYVGKVKEFFSEEEKLMATFLRRKENSFVYPNVPDESIVLLKDVVKVLPTPLIRRGMHIFNTNLSSFAEGNPLTIL